jgi:hypothetical protein
LSFEQDAYIVYNLDFHIHTKLRLEGLQDRDMGMREDASQERTHLDPVSGEDTSRSCFRRGHASILSQERIHLNPGQERTHLDPGQERTRLDPSQERTHLDLGQEKTDLDPGQEKTKARRGP